MFAKCKPKSGNHGLGPICALLNLFGAFCETEDEKHLKLNAEYFDILFQKYQLAFGIQYDAFFTPDVTLLTMILQCFCSSHTFREALIKISLYSVEWGDEGIQADANSAYTRARRKIPVALLEDLAYEMARRAYLDIVKVFPNRLNLVAVDGTTFTLADTEYNQLRFPQPSSRKKGLGFPMIRALMFFNVATGMLEAMDYAPYAGKDTGETSLFRKLMGKLIPGQIVVADAVHCTYWQIAWCKERGIPVIMALHGKRSGDMRRGRSLGPGDRLQSWTRPRKPVWMSEEDYAKYPKELEIRVVEATLSRPGFRCKRKNLATTLDLENYPAPEVFDLYRSRWQVETSFREFKTILDMGHLRAQNPEMMARELWSGIVAYNYLRMLIYRMAKKLKEPLYEMSFKGALAVLRESLKDELLPRIETLEKRTKRNAVRLKLFADTNFQRPNRTQPRKLKRRNRYSYLSAPRAEEIAKIIKLQSTRRRKRKSPRKGGKVSTMDAQQNINPKLT